LILYSRLFKDLLSLPCLSTGKIYTLVKIFIMVFKSLFFSKLREGESYLANELVAKAISSPI
jgi:hypothetical protein